MHSTALLVAKNRELRAANEKQKRKRERRRTYIDQKDALTVKKEMNRVRRVNEEERERIEVSKD
jgi:hypothetical protein